VNGRGYSGGMGFGPPITPPVIKQLLIANALVFVAQKLFPWVTSLGSVSPAGFLQHGMLWQPFTYMFLNDPSNLLHLLFNMFMLWMFGSQVAAVWGSARFLRYYLTCGVGAGVVIALVPYLFVWLGIRSPMSLALPTLGASGAIYGVVLAFSLIWPDRTIALMFPPVAFRAIWLIPVMVGVDLLMGPSNVSILGHLSGAGIGWLLLRGSGTGPGLPSLEQIQYRWNRYRMRKRLRSVHRQDSGWRRAAGGDRTLH
jgi:membrane associated rhomboid family serine protease